MGENKTELEYALEEIAEGNLQEMYDSLDETHKFHFKNTVEEQRLGSTSSGFMKRLLEKLHAMQKRRNEKIEAMIEADVKRIETDWKGTCRVTGTMEVDDFDKQWKERNKTTDETNERV